ncbi:MAG: DUF3298 domain-containing protein [Christensenellaceae bacterium]|nr:DUF3298 domain-containing protein [Christensenellaceae bacterium]
MKRLMILLLALMTLLSAASAEELLTLAEPLEGVICWPDGTNEDTASYVYRYCYPQVAGESEIAEQINGTYAYEVDDAYDFRVPMNAEGLDLDAGMQFFTSIGYEITCLNEHYLSVKITSESFLGYSLTTTIAGHTFTLDDGAKTGSVTSLPYLLGILDGDDAKDEWMKDRQTARADECVRKLIWEIIEQQIMRGEVAYYDDLDYEMFCDNFYPEEAFYLNADGDPVFFIQEGFVAPVAEGVLLFPFTMEELLDEI